MTKTKEELLEELTKLYSEANQDPDELARQSKINDSSFKKRVTELAEELKKIELDKTDPLDQLKEAYTIYLTEGNENNKFNVLFSALEIAIDAYDNRSIFAADPTTESLASSENREGGVEIEDLPNKRFFRVESFDRGLADDAGSITSEDDEKSKKSKTLTEEGSIYSTDDEEEKYEKKERYFNTGTDPAVIYASDIEYLRPKDPIRVPSTSLRPENSDPFRSFASMQPDWIVRNPTGTVDPNGSALYKKIEKEGGWEWERRDTKYETSEYFQNLEKLREHLSGSQLATDGEGKPIWYGDENDDLSQNPHHIRQEANITKVTMPGGKETYRITYIDEKKNLVDMIAPKAVLDNVSQIDQKYGKEIIKLNSGLAQAKEALEKEQKIHDEKSETLVSEIRELEIKSKALEAAIQKANSQSYDATATQEELNQNSLELAGKKGELGGRGEALKGAQDKFTGLRNQLLEIEEQAKKEKQQEIKRVVNLAKDLNKNVTENVDVDDAAQKLFDSKIRVKASVNGLVDRLTRTIDNAINKDAKKEDIANIFRQVVKESPPVIPGDIEDAAGNRIESLAGTIKRSKIDTPGFSIDGKPVDNMNVISFNAADFAASRTSNSEIHLQAPGSNDLVFKFTIIGQNSRDGKKTESRPGFLNRDYDPGTVVFEGVMRRTGSKDANGKDIFVKTDTKETALNPKEKEMVRTTAVYATYTTYTKDENGNAIQQTTRNLVVNNEDMKYQDPPKTISQTQPERVSWNSLNDDPSNLHQQISKSVTETYPLRTKEMAEGLCNTKKVFVGSVLDEAQNLIVTDKDKKKVEEILKTIQQDRKSEPKVFDATKFKEDYNSKIIEEDKYKILGGENGKKILDIDLVDLEKNRGKDESFLVKVPDQKEYFFKFKFDESGSMVFDDVVKFAESTTFARDAGGFSKPLVKSSTFASPSPEEKKIIQEIKDQVAVHASYTKYSQDEKGEVSQQKSTILIADGKKMTHQEGAKKAVIGGGGPKKYDDLVGEFSKEILKPSTSPHPSAAERVAGREIYAAASRA